MFQPKKNKHLLEIDKCLYRLKDKFLDATLFLYHEYWRQSKLRKFAAAVVWANIFIVKVMSFFQEDQVEEEEDTWCTKMHTSLLKRKIMG